MSATSNVITSVDTINIDVINAQYTVANPRTATYRLTATLQGVALNLYAISATPGAPMVLPPAFQATDGVDIGGVGPELWATINPNDFGYPVPNWRGRLPGSFQGVAPEFDSWLTVGMVAGDTAHELGSDIVLTRWDENTPVSVTTGGVYWTNPANGPPNREPVAVAQFTVREGDSFETTMHLTGKQLVGADWDQDATWRLR